jgi:PAS domain-containing protein
MSDGNKFDVITYAQQHQQNRLPLDEMGNVLLDAMQGTLICLDNHHIIIDVSKTIKNYFGFEQADILGLSILLLIEDSERDVFSKFLSSTSQLFDICCVRMMMSITNEYRQVKVHRKRKFNQETVDVHSTTTTTRSVGTILVLTLDDSSYIDISLFDIDKQEFYTKMNLIGEITFEDHRGALITGYLPHEIISQSIFSLVYHEDRLVKLHALWKCATTGGSKLQWRLTGRNGSLVYLQTEYKLIANHQNQDTIVARNEVLSPVQRAQFEELQTAWRHQCAADIRGNSSSFKRMTSADTDLSSLPSGECCICVPSLNMCFSTNKLHSLNIIGNIFDVSKPAHPLTIQDYVSILIDHDKYLDNELINMINNLSSLSSRYKHLSNQSTNETDSLDITMNEKSQFDYSESTSRKKNDSDSIVRGILSNSMKYNHEKQTGDSSSTLTRFLNGNSGQNDLLTSQQQQSQSKASPIPLNPEAIQQQHIDFIKKYRAAKAKLEAQLELTRTQEITNGGQTNDIMKRVCIK